MAGWYVRRDADVLDAEWFLTWPPAVQQDFQPGQYVLSISGKYAEWTIH